MSTGDRLDRVWDALVRSAHPRIDCLTLYFGKVVAQSDDLTEVDVEPSDPKMPGMSRVPLRGEPGVLTDLRDPVTRRVPDGISVLVGFPNGDPAGRYACLWLGADRATKKTIAADVLNLGGEEGAEPPPKGVTLNGALTTFLGALSAYATAIKPIADPTNAATPALLSAITALTSALPTTLAMNAKVR